VSPLKKRLWWVHVCGLLTSPSLGMMLVRWTTSRWADWETRESDDSEMMWSHIPAKVLHWRWWTGGEKTKRGKERVRNYRDCFLVREGCRDLAGGGEITSSDCSTSTSITPVAVGPRACPRDAVTDRTTHHRYRPPPEEPTGHFITSKSHISFLVICLFVLLSDTLEVLRLPVLQFFPLHTIYIYIYIYICIYIFLMQIT